MELGVSDWAPVLTSLWVEYEDAADYALAELAEAEYEAGVAAENVLRRKWELTIDAGDRNIRRDGQVDAKTGRQAITALWDAWELGTSVTFKDIDNDTDPVAYIVAIVGMEEKAAKPADGARWGESTVTLILEETAPGVVAAPPGFDLEDLGDVTIAAPADGQVLTYDNATGQWVNEVVAASHDPVTVVDTGSIDLALTGQQLSAAAIFGAGAGQVAQGNHAHAGVYQPLDADLTTLAVNISAAGHALVDDADAAAQRATLGLDAGGAGDIWVEKGGDTMTGALTTERSAQLSLIAAKVGVDANGGIVRFQKTRGADAATHVIMQNGDVIGRFDFTGSDGGAYRTAALIQAIVDGVPGASSMPGALQFFTTPVGAAVAVLRALIDNTGLLRLMQGMRVEGASGLGFGTGAGGTVVQATSKATGVTLNKSSGQITMNGAALAAGAEVSFVVTNSLVEATDVVIVNIASVGTVGSYAAVVSAVAAGSFTITLTNLSGGSLSQALVLNFAVIKGASS